MIIWYLSESSHNLPNTNGNVASPRSLIRSDPRGDQIVLVGWKQGTAGYKVIRVQASNQTFREIVVLFFFET